MKKNYILIVMLWLMTGPIFLKAQEKIEMDFMGMKDVISGLTANMGQEEFRLIAGNAANTSVSPKASAANPKCAANVLRIAKDALNSYWVSEGLKESVKITKTAFAPVLKLFGLDVSVDMVEALIISDDKDEFVKNMEKLVAKKMIGKAANSLPTGWDATNNAFTNQASKDIGNLFTNVFYPEDKQVFTFKYDPGTSIIPFKSKTIC
ncbi:MAG: hypothetical protein AAF206_12675, partial [Bacteroidota bacterium]